MADIFVSYAHLNKGRVAKIADGLEKAGFNLWWDERIRVGSDFAMEIEKELDNAKCVVVAWSGAARNSLWVRAEASQALDDGKLVQVRLDGVRPPLPFTVVQMSDFSRWRSVGDAPWHELEASARAHAGGRREEPDPRTFQGPALQDFGGVAMIGWFSLGLIALMAWLTLQIGNGVSAELYERVSWGAFGASCLSLLLTLSRVVSTAIASRPT
jgi:hypothetical protein